jgi:hypothetical protein
MTRQSLPEVSIRTTSDGDGYPHGIAVGAGDDPTAALDAVAVVAKDTIAGLIRRLGLRDADMFGADDWGIEVIDVRLVPGTDPDAHAAWTAYGTVCTTGLSPVAPEDQR